ncbi:xanthine phosphoribosyltransferase [Clostridium sp. MT-14]|jgi:xanthine phosphoribosyltransferase|uniref:Xanthine phosphoribosyltransferase n=1 Tax=Clostridium aromativorans TaxID=2836848 RepID=A0ABS8N423_9CLOT|nr:xanthine phosphoribosyltransferase [Clostridium aromativorans]MCC9293840.1 xanthine phosphoribosyltransferase [Clostridium aromativorans]CAB1241275.1 xanthine phosphoribosyltransferase [Clostridiaceae bacterium BL-3]
MDSLKRRILKDGLVIDKNILKVDSFLNHQVDLNLMYEIGTYFKNYFKEAKPTKIFTVESSGIAPASMTALQMGLPMVILKKETSKILSDNIYQTVIHSFTKSIDYNLTLSKKYITAKDRILIIDDFLAKGEAASGAIRLIESAGAEVSGIGIVIEKSFQPGRKLLESKGYRVYSLARISSLEQGCIKFCSDKNPSAK